MVRRSACIIRASDDHSQLQWGAAICGKLPVCTIYGSSHFLASTGECCRLMMARAFYPLLVL